MNQRSLLAALLTVTTVARAQPCDIPATPPAIAKQTYTYNSYGETLDLYLPPGDTNGQDYPLVLVVHGGEWIVGNSGQPDIVSTAQYLASFGFAAAAIDYRLDSVPQNIFPAALEDARCAVRYLRENAAAMKFNAARIGALGFSVGGNMVEMLAQPAAAFDETGCLANIDTSPAIQAVADYYGLDNSTDLGGKVMTFFPHYLGVSPLQNPKLAAEATPQSYLSLATAPIFLTHGTDDPVIPEQQAIDYANTAAIAGVPVQFWPEPGFAHGYYPFTVAANPALLPSTCAMLDFLKLNLRPR